MSWLNAINPVGPIPDEAQARKAARSASIALFLGGAYALAMMVLAMTSGADQLRAASEAIATESNLEGHAAALAQGVLWTGVLFGVLQLAAGALQWVRPGLVLPIIVAILVVWGLVQTLLTLAGLAGGETVWAKLGLLVIQLLLCVSAIRGGNVLDRFRRARNS